MKIKNLPLLLVFFLLLMYGSAEITVAQSCNDYFMLTDNAEYEIITYNKKDKQTGKAVYKVQSVDKNGGKTEATIHTQIYDDKGKLSTEGDYKVSCEGGTVWVDMRSMFNNEMLEAYKDMEVKMQGDMIDYPSALAAGQKLKDGTFTVDINDKKSGQNLSTIEMKAVDRTVDSKESIKTPAGTFDAYKIKQDTEVRTKAMGMNLPAARMQTIEWYHPGTGFVRSETYRNGNLMSYSVLNRISK